MPSLFAGTVKIKTDHNHKWIIFFDRTPYPVHLPFWDSGSDFSLMELWAEGGHGGSRASAQDSIGEGAISDFEVDPI